MKEFVQALRKFAPKVLRPPILARGNLQNGFLNLDSKIYSKEEIEDLFKQIAGRDQVRYLRLRDNNLDPEHAEIIAKYLADTKLEDLDLSQNNLGDEGAMVLAQVLEKRNLMLKTINLKENKIGPTGGGEIFKSLEQNQHLNRIYLGDNPELFGGDFATYFIDSLKKNTGLKIVDFDPSPQIPEQTRQEITSVFKNNHTLSGVIYRHQIGRLGSWSSYDNSYVPGVSDSNPRFSQLDDAVNDYSTILLTRIIRKIVADDPSFTLDRESISDLKKIANEFSRTALLQDLSQEQIGQFAETWHDPFRQIQSQKLRDFGDETWPTLSKEKKIEILPVPEISGEKGWSLVCLNNSRELKEEGNALNHCVGTYSSNCILGKSHIFSLRKDNLPVSTIELTKGVEEFSIKQHKAKENEDPSAKEAAIAKWLVDSINNKEIAISQLELKQRDDGLVRALGFNPFDDKKVREVVNGFKNKILPSGKLEIPTLTRNFDNFLGDVSLKSALPENDFNLQSLRPQDQNAQNNLLAKSRESLQVSLNRIFGGDENSPPIARASLIEGKIFVFTNEEAVSEKLESLLEGHLESRKDGFLITGEISEVRKILAQEALSIRQNQKNEKKQKKSLTSKDDSQIDSPNSKVSNPEVVRSVCDVDLERF